METFISKPASFHKTCHNRYDRCYLQRKLKNLKNVHETVKDENIAVNLAETSDNEDAVQQDHFNSIENNCHFATKKIHKKIWDK